MENIKDLEDINVEEIEPSTSSSSTPDISNILAGIVKVENAPTNIEIPLCCETKDDTYESFVKLNKDEELVFKTLLNKREVAYISEDTKCFPSAVTYDEFASGVHLTSTASSVHLTSTASSVQNFDTIVLDRVLNVRGAGCIENVLAKSGLVIARVIVDKACLPKDSYNNPDITLHTHFGAKLRGESFTPPSFVIYSKYNVELWIWCAFSPEMHAILLDANSYTASVQQAKKAQLMALHGSGKPFRFRGDFGGDEDAEDGRTAHTYTSGTTGDPVRVPHTEESKLLFNASGIRELLWKGWDIRDRSKKILVCLSIVKDDRIDGNIHYKAYRGAEDMQRSLEEISPSYLFTYPSIVEDLDLSRIPSIVDIKTRGEIGNTVQSTCYYAEETGIIALRCPEAGNYHVMEHIYLEQHPDAYAGVAVTDITNPYVQRYILGDHVELSPNNHVCSCGRKTEVIKNILGRTRNMLTNIDGDKIFPVFEDYQKKMPRFQIVQISTTEFEFRKKDRDFDYYKYKIFIDHLQIDLRKLAGSKEIDLKIVPVDEFHRPFERFISHVE